GDGGARGAGCELGTDRTGAAGRECDAGANGRIGGDGDCVRRREDFDGNWCVESAAVARDCGGLADDGVRTGIIGGCGALVRIDSGAEVREFTRWGVVSRSGGKDDEREPRAAASAQYPGGRASGE